MTTNPRKRHVPIVIAGTAAIILSGCAGGSIGDLPAELPESTTTTTTTTSPRSTPTTTSPTSQPEANPTHAAIVPTDVPQMIGDIEAFWATRGVSLDVGSSEAAPVKCGTTVYETSPAVYCFKEDQVVHRPLEGAVTETLDRMLMVQTMIAHEMGHAVQDEVDRLDGPEGDRQVDGWDVRELSADCFAGIYMATQNPLARSHEIDTLTGPRTTAYQFGLNLPDGEQEQCLTKWGG